LRWLLRDGYCSYYSFVAREQAAQALTAVVGDALQLDDIRLRLT
jgi:hypothetical protein